MKTTIYLNFDGRCQQAFKFYREVLGAEIGTVTTFGETPAANQVPSEWQNKVVNGEMFLNGVRIAGGDLSPEQYVPPKGFAILLSIDNEAETKAIFNKLSEEGTILTPIQKTFFSSYYGIVIDKYGVTWKLSCVN